jgi:pimeloyl-ACP methyl ester carboxylesterase
MTKQRYLSIARLACVSLLPFTFVVGQQIPSAVTSDPAPDKEFPAKMQAPDVLSHGARLNAVLYVASGSGPHPTVLLMHGFPGNEQNMDLAYAVRRAGWNVLAPHYRGSWGSAGTFSFSNAIEDTQAAIEFLRDRENVKKYRIDPQRIVLVGHSMGGFMVAYAAAHDPGVIGAAMISAWNIGVSVSRSPEKATLEDFQSASSRLAGSTPEGLLAEAKQNASKWNFLDYAADLKTRPVLVVESNDDLAADDRAMAEALRKAGDSQVTELHMATDHPYSDHRIALQIAVLNWLQRVANKASK